MRLCFLHGLDSSPQGTKSRLLKTHYPDCLIPSLPPDIQERVRIVKQLIHEPTVVIGSSLGGLTALMFAIALPERISALLLLAPAVGFHNERNFAEDQKRILRSIFVPAAIPTVIIAGTRDDVIPLSSIRALVRRSPEPYRIQLREVDDDHSLHLSIGLMLESIEQIRMKLFNNR